MLLQAQSFATATVVGNFAGGRLNDVVSTRKAMMILLWGLNVSFVLIALAVHNEIAIFTLIAIRGFLPLRSPVMQAGVVATAEQVAPDALATASGFNIAAFNLGISGGSFIGGQLLKQHGLLATPYASIAVAAIALLIVTFALRPERAIVNPKAT
jgi:DHA1 family inner membrane transport protein